MKKSREEIIRALNTVNAPGHDLLYVKIAEALEHKELTVETIFVILRNAVSFWIVCHPFADGFYLSGTLLPQWLEALTPIELLPEMRNKIASSLSLPN